MTYFGVLATFILPPLLILLILTPTEVWRRLLRGEGYVSAQPYLIILAHVVMALVYTTPWDNYLVATGVWWYDPALVTGIQIGWVPIEEYTFFVVQTLLTGFWALFLMRRVFREEPDVRQSPRFRAVVSVVLIVLWIVSTAVLLAGWVPGTYLTLIVSWALVPILIQTVFGADILLANWKLLVAIILPPTLYLWLIDSLAITAGTWTIDPVQTTGLMVGALPIEEMIFFFITNVIIGFGVTLMLSPVSKVRAQEWVARFRRPSAGVEGLHAQ